ncbi:MAG: FAD-binding and (Fe-S)-binding domain-containing protein [Acidobacteriota bacterium]
MPATVSEMARELEGRIEGEVRFDRYSRLLYSTDASIYQIEPLGVVIPRHRDDVEQTVRIAARERAPLLPRGGGTSLAGQAVGEAVILDFSKYMNRLLEVSRAEGWVRVQPGIVQDVLGAHLKPYGVRFGPETATSNRANMGGMIGNNSAGARSLIYGKTVDNVLEVTAILADGTEAVFGPVHRKDLGAKTRGDSLEARIYRTAAALAEQHREEINSRYPRIPRRVSGYNLDELLDAEEVNLAKLVVGSEGTLATVVEAKLKTVPLPGATGLAVLHFEGLLPALETACEALALSPSAVELVDRMVLELARESLEYSRRLHFVVGDPHALIVVEFYGDTEAEVVSKLDSLESRLGRRSQAVVRVVEPAAQANVWKVRKATLPLLLSLPGDHKPIAFVEDTAVDPERLPEYVRRFNELLEAHQTKGSFYAHAGAGCLHIRPLINLKDGAGIEKMHRLAEEVSDLVLEFGGAMSGEHGDGLARSHFNRKIFGDGLYRAFQEVKAAFDPQGIMNPGKVVHGPSMTENLRYRPSYQTIDLPTEFSYRREGGFARAVELCNGAGVCRKNLEGTMCPSYMVTLEEEHSTRGRANALRAVLDGRLPPEELTGERLYQVMDLCISCKGCKAECPSSVDMARLKSEFLALYHREHPFSLRDRLFVQAETAGKLGVATTPLSNWMIRQGWLRALLEHAVGIDRRRSLPPFARQSFADWFSRREAGSETGATRRGRVLLFHDTFMNYHEPEIGIAAARLLEAAGYEVILAEKRCCGRPALSKGMLGEARALAEANVRALHPYVQEGCAIVGCEPSCLLSLRDEYLELVPGPEAEAVAKQAFLLEEFFLKAGGEIDFPSPPEKVLVHGHCHQKALVGTDPMLRFLERTGARVELVDSGCCGMAGSFGYDREHFDVSKKMAERCLLPALRQAEAETVLAASGTSCRHQIRDGTGRRAYHPVEIAARAAGLI